MKIIAFLAALLIGAAPLAASASTDIFAFDSFNPSNRGVGISTSIAKVGPIQLSPALTVQQADGHAHFGIGAIASVNVLKHFDLGVGVFKRPVGGFTLTSNSYQPAVSLGVRL